MLSEFSESVKLASGVTVSCEHFKLERPGKHELKAEINFFDGMIYIWIGSASMHQLNNLQIAYPGAVKQITVLYDSFNIFYFRISIQQFVSL